MARRKRRKFTPEFKAEAVRLARAGERSIQQVAENLDLTESALRNWLKQSEVDAGQGPPDALTTAEKSELSDLRREVKRLRQERDILKAAAADSMGRGNGLMLYGPMEGITSGKSEAWSEHGTEI